ncbi:MAG: hypothetical protein ABI635_06740 [Actinomycetota bacterium]
MTIVFTSVGFPGVVGITDCEALHAGLLRQPVNALSSLTLLAAGLWILQRSLRREPGNRAEAVVFGAGTAIVGVGSVLLHGPNPGWALWLHDLGGLAVLLVVMMGNLGGMLGWAFRRRILAAAVGLGALAVELATLPTSTVPIAWLLAPAAALSQMAALWLRPRASAGPTASTATIAWVIACLALALGGAAFLLGRADSALCHPESLLQLHAVWHVLVAISATAFASAAFGHPAGPSSARPTGSAA